MHAGGDFIKTSTARFNPPPRKPVTLVMLEAIRDFYYAPAKKIGMKPAGGIATPKSPPYLVMPPRNPRPRLAYPDLYRIGAADLPMTFSCS